MGSADSEDESGSGGKKMGGVQADSMECEESRSEKE